MKTLSKFLAVALVVLTGLWINIAPATALNLDQSLIAMERRNAADEMLETEFGQKVDLNNADIRDFRGLKGFFPNLASKIINNAPYNSVEDVLDIPDLSEKQKERLEANLDTFTVTPPSEIFNNEANRFNPGVY
ncbi:MAG: photosystem II complex extrinsic protein PsbU [Synechococcaceae cyanobacterium RL_1_2]|nr:photosystem II complex extrinsic protein PsbU [Synechococcaceae cyanobacterium RL_1_2]